MLQQTQVSRVLEKYGLFLARFPSVRALAAAPEREVLAAWSGLGYYQRARSLHGAAKAIAARPGARMPRTTEELLSLPGVGRYTAGAIASMVFGLSAPLVDGNVSRVLLRLGGRALPHGSSEALRWSWSRAEKLVRAAADPGSFNEALMELGATVCTPRNPDCPRCSLRRACAARATGRQHAIPSPKRPVIRRPLHCASVVLRDARGRTLVEPRPLCGLWAGLWQAPTLEAPERAPSPGDLREWLGLSNIHSEGSFRHGTTHRDVVFHLWRSPPLARAAAGRVGRARPGAEWLAEERIRALPLSNPQRRILLGAPPLP
jgi:A/G-specific adenine glycosylase